MPEPRLLTRAALRQHLGDISWSQVEELILGFPALAPHYLLEVSRPGRMDELLVRVEARPVGSDPEIGRRLAASIKERIGISCSVDVGQPGSLARSAGKATRVVDKR